MFAFAAASITLNFVHTEIRTCCNNTNRNNDNTTTRSYRAASAATMWWADADLPASAMEGALLPLADHLPCPICRQSLVAHVKELTVRWSMVRVSTRDQSIRLSQLLLTWARQRSI